MALPGGAAPSSTPVEGYPAAKPRPQLADLHADLVDVHFSDGEPCERSPLDHGDPICVHGARLVEAWR